MLDQKAKLFATAAHAAVGQIRKYTGEPYIVHPIEVAEIVSRVEHTVEQLAAAYLHDVLEDTQVTEAVIRAEFGDVVADLVVGLTAVSKGSTGNRAERKAADRDFLSAQSGAVHTIKLADLISNTKSIAEHDQKFAKVYLKEKLDLLEVLTKGDASLHTYATWQCTLALTSLGD